MRLLVPSAALLVALATGLGAWRWRVAPLFAHPCPPESPGSCASCHRMQIPADHTPEFQSQKHGRPARANRSECLGCHEERSCRDCHARQPPPWHGEEFRHPGRGARERAMHVREASARRAACLECHQPSYHRQCAACHRPGEHEK